MRNFEHQPQCRASVLALFTTILVTIIPCVAAAWSYSFAETNGGKIVRLEIVSWGTGDVATGGKPAYGGAKLTIRDPSGATILAEEFPEAEYDFQILANGDAKVEFKAKTQNVEVAYSFRGTDQAADDDERLILILRDRTRPTEKGNSLTIKDKKSGRNYSFKDIICHIVKDV